MKGIERIGVAGFEGERLARPGTWAVAFLADWCPYCDVFFPRFAALAGGGDRLLIADVSDDTSPLWDRFRVEIVPTVIVFHDGVPRSRFDGISGKGLDAHQVAQIRSALTPDDAVTGSRGTRRGRR